MKNHKRKWKNYDGRQKKNKQLLYYDKHGDYDKYIEFDK